MLHLHRGEHDVIEHRHVREQIEPLEHHANLFAHLIDICFTRKSDPINGDLTRRRFLKMIHAAQKRALA